MKEYEKPTITVVELTLEDVIVTSSFGGPNQMNDDYTENNFWGAN